MAFRGPGARCLYGPNGQLIPPSPPGIQDLVASPLAVTAAIRAVFALHGIAKTGALKRKSAQPLNPKPLKPQNPKPSTRAPKPQSV